MISYRIAFPQPERHFAAVEARFPTGGRDTIALLMARWSPGFYRVEEYATRIEEITARSLDGSPRPIRRTGPSGWRVRTAGEPEVVVSYRLRCEERSVTTNWVGRDGAVINGPATFLILAGETEQEHEVRLELPRSWPDSACSLPQSGDHRYLAASFDALADSPLVAGRLAVDRFDVDGCEHAVVAAGELGRWDRRRARADLERIAHGHLQLWGFLPFDHYVFLLLLREGGGGLEHRNCTLVTTHPAATRSHGRYRHWLGLVCHEYLHAYNGKRLRPRELGPFDYRRPPRTRSLWVAEGCTSYYGDLVLARSGLASGRYVLGRLSSHIELVQTSPGRHLQTLEQSSLEVWTNSFSGIETDERTVSYYAKGAVVAFLLDARIRRETGGERSLDDVVRLAYRRHSGERGFTPREFSRTVSDAAGFDLASWLERAVRSTDELDYEEALDLYGLRFLPGTWKLAPRRDARRPQREARRAWLTAAGPVDTAV